MATMRMPPKNFLFDHSIYASADDELNAEYQEGGDKLRHIYPELKTWPNWACEVAYMDYGEALQYCGNPYNDQPREDEFIAFLYANQELGNKGYFRREDGTPFTHYDIDSLDDIWAKYDDYNGNENK